MAESGIANAGALAAGTAATVGAALLAATVGGTHFTGAILADLAISAGRVTGHALKGIGARRIGSTIGATVVEFALPATGRIPATCTVDTVELVAVAPGHSPHVVATTFVADAGTVRAAGLIQAEAIVRILSQSRCRNQQRRH